MQWERRFRKLAIGENSVRLGPASVGGAKAEAHPSQLGIDEITLVTPGIPPAEFWGVTATDNDEYIVTFRKVGG